LFGLEENHVLVSQVSECYDLSNPIYYNFISIYQILIQVVLLYILEVMRNLI